VSIVTAVCGLESHIEQQSIKGAREMRKWIVVAMLLGNFCFAANVSAEESKLELKAGATMKDVLTESTGKRVALRLGSGEEIEGTVTMVGTSLVHISRLAGKEFFDAVVSIDKVSAVRMKVRDK
jgi:urease accessory protein UreF